MISPEHRQLALRYGQGESVRQLCYEYGLHDNVVYKIISAVSEHDGIDLRTQHKLNRRQAKTRWLRALQQRYRDGESVAQLSLEMGLPVAEVHQRLRHGVVGISSDQLPRPTLVSASRESALRSSAADLLSEQPDASIEVLRELMRSPLERDLIEQIWAEHQPVRRTRRAERFVQQYLEGMTLAQVGAEHDISRERVRQIIEKHFPGGFELAMQSRQARTQERIRQRREAVLRRARQWLQGKGAVQAKVLDAAIRPHKDDASWLHTQVGDRLTHGSATGAVFTDEDLVGAVRAAAAAIKGPLTTKSYDQVRQIGWPSSALIVHRIGWNEAARRAGLSPTKAQRSYEHKWDATAVTQWVHRFRQEVPGGSSLVYDRWQRQHPQAPSLATVTLVLGGWTQAITAALKVS